MTTKNRWQRVKSTAHVANVAARIAARKVTKRNETDRDRELGEELALELDQMKGMAMKVGQVMSYFDGILPETVHRALATLQRGAFAVPFTAMSEVVQDAFGLPINALFDSFEETPVASASIGQVYRATWKGAQVAVKVQYPTVRASIDGDFSRLTALSRLATLGSAADGRAIVDELRSAFVSECDYTLEARNQNAFVAALSGQDDLIVPEAVLERTRPTVLTTAWCDGASLEEFQRGATSEHKRKIAQSLARFAHHSFYVLACINADPHPGNYIFPGDGRLALIDFGCVRHFEAPFVASERELVNIVINDRRNRFEDAVVRTGMLNRTRGFDFDHHWRMLRHQWEPYCRDTYRVTSEYVRKAMTFAGPSNPNLRLLRIPPPWVWLQRLQWGLHSVLARFDVEVPYRRILCDVLDRPARPITSFSLDRL